MKRISEISVFSVIITSCLLIQELVIGDHKNFKKNMKKL